MLLRLYFASLIVCCIARKENILLIIVDDLRTALGCYGDSKAYTPNIDRLASKSALFSQAYAQQALCGPSRNSFLTSRRPDTLELYDFYSYWRETVGNFTTLPQHFKNNGYVSMSVGKVFHPGISSNYSDDSPYSWTKEPFHPYTNLYKDTPNCPTNFRMPPARNLVCPVNVSKMPNKTLPDIEIMKEAKRFIRNHAAKSADPFFLAVGFQKPHIPFKYPARYLKHHPLQKFDVPSPYEWPENVSSIAYNPWIDLRKREDVASMNLEFPWEKIPGAITCSSLTANKLWQTNHPILLCIRDVHRRYDRQPYESIGNFVHSREYYCGINIGSRVGWSLGEHATWAKYSNFDVAVKVPLIISIPGITFEESMEKLSDHGANSMSIEGDFSYNVTATKIKKNRMVIDAPVELVDLFPTLTDLANIPIPVCLEESSDEGFVRSNNSRDLCSEGITLVPLIRSVLEGKAIPWKVAAFGQYPRPGLRPTMNPNSDEPRLKEIKAMGYTLKTKRYRYTLWLKFRPEFKRPDWKDIIEEELYDHAVDVAENRNVAASGKYSVIKGNLKNLLKVGWRGALPKKCNATVAA